ncbi:MAG: hypothetical protein KDC55_12115 [Ignavibacteriae bacterium]|nr:hypothetical protein [Ignavibacteriota bacterium]
MNKCIYFTFFSLISTLSVSQTYNIDSVLKCYYGNYPANLITSYAFNSNDFELFVVVQRDLLVISLTESFQVSKIYQTQVNTERIQPEMRLLKGNYGPSLLSIYYSADNSTIDSLAFSVIDSSYNVHKLGSFECPYKFVCNNVDIVSMVGYYLQSDSLIIINYGSPSFLITYSNSSRGKLIEQNQENYVDEITGDKYIKANFNDSSGDALLNSMGATILSSTKEFYIDELPAFYIYDDAVFLSGENDCFYKISNKETCCMELPFQFLPFHIAGRLAYNYSIVTGLLRIVNIDEFCENK